MVGEGDDVRVVLDDQHGVPLVAQPQQQIAEASHITRVQPDARFVEDVRHPGQARAEMPHRLQALALSAGERGGLPIEAEVSEPDRLDPLQRGHGRPRDRPRDGVIDVLEHGDQVADLHPGAVRDGQSADAGGERRRVQPCAPAHRAGVLRQETLDLVAGLLAERRQVPLEVQPLETVGEPFVVGAPGAAGAADGDFAAGTPTQQELPLGVGELAYGFVRVQFGGVRVRLPLPGPDGERREADRAVRERPVRVQDAVPVGPDRAPQAVALGAHARRIVERVRARQTRARSAVPRERHADHRVHVRHRAHGGPGVTADRPLVDDDRR
jgi:hypothetical protein